MIKGKKIVIGCLLLLIGSLITCGPVHQTVRPDGNNLGNVKKLAIVIPVEGDKQEKGQDESIWLYVRVKEVKSRTEPDVTSEELGKMTFGDKIQVLERKDSWLKISHPSVKGQGWVHSLVTSISKAEIEILQTQDKIPKLILLLDAENGGIWSSTLSGGIKVPNEKLQEALSGKYTPELYPNDCIILTDRAFANIQKPLKIMNSSIQNPIPNKLYCFYKSGGELELLDESPLRGNSSRRLSGEPDGPRSAAHQSGSRGGATPPAQPPG